MQQRKAVVITIIALILGCSLIALVYLLLAPTAPGNKEPVSYPNSYPNSYNVVRPTPQELKKYVYATVEENGQLKMKTVMNEEVVISIDDKNWKDVTWAPDGLLISVLGETKEGIFNLFIYDLQQQNLKQITNYIDESIDSHVWQSNDIVLFTQGELEGKWLHRYSYKSKSEILKLARVQGTIYSISPNFSTLIIDHSTSFSIYNVEGVKIQDISLAKIENIIFDFDSEGLLVKTDGDRFFTLDIIQNEVVEIPFAEAVVPICGGESLTFRAFKLENRTDVSLVDFAITSEVSTNITTKFFKDPVQVEKSSCYNNENVLININVNEENNWYFLNQDDTLEKILAFDGAKDATIRNTL